MILVLITVWTYTPNDNNSMDIYIYKTVHFSELHLLTQSIEVGH